MCFAKGAMKYVRSGAMVGSLELDAVDQGPDVEAPRVFFGYV